MGYKVVLETNDFNAYCNTHGLTYNDLYTVSNKYLNDALVNYGGFDLCIDLHRDSVPRAYSYIKIGNKTYAKAMMVVAGSSSNVKSATKISTTLTDMVNKRKNGIMKHVMTRQEAYYNQYVHKGIVLMECGSDYNTFEEVKTLDGCVLDENKHTFTFKQKDFTTKNYSKELNIENKTTHFNFQ